MTKITKKGLQEIKDKLNTIDPNDSRADKRLFALVTSILYVTCKNKSQDQIEEIREELDDIFDNL
jgi:hypothetical protein